MPESKSFLLKYRKNRPALGAVLPPDSLISSISLQIPHCELI